MFPSSSPPDVASLEGLDLAEEVHLQRLWLHDLPDEVQRRLAEDARIGFLTQDSRGRFVGCRSLLFGQCEIIRTPPFDLTFADDTWMYPSDAEAVQAWSEWLTRPGWEQHGQEPAGWRRHMPSGRRAAEQGEKP
jgi:hypothetical protein